MPIYYSLYEAMPLPASDDFEECGGAYVNCWVRAASRAEASKLASDHLRDQNWKLLMVEEEPQEVSEAYYSDNDEGRDGYLQAVAEGECYVFNLWPVDPQEGDEIH